MSRTHLSRAFLPRLRSRAGTLTIGACAAALLAGGGVAQATGNADLFGTSSSTELAHYAATQADLRQSGSATDAKLAIDGKATEVQTAVDRAAKQAEAEKAAEAKAAKEKKAAEQKANGWTAPISGGYTISATYGNSGNRWAAGHSGQDYAVSSGTAVHSVAKGTVVKAGGNGAGDGPAYGNAVVVKHGNGTYSQYAHLSNVQVSVGDQVKSGEQIARSGNTGNSSGPHLHLEIRTTPDYGSAIDPAKFLRDKGVG